MSEENQKIRNKIDFHKEFEDWYWIINKDLNFDYKLDQQARDLLSAFFNEKVHNWNLETILKSFCDMIQAKNSIFIYGCGPSLETTLNHIIRTANFDISEKISHLSADGATSLLRKKKIPIDAVFTDLDGISMEDFLYPAYIIVHAHGDNINKLKSYKRQIIHTEKIIGTTQVKPTDNIINPGGFTDGDRILFFIKSLIKPNQKIFLIGMDFGTIVGKYSKPDFKKHKKASPIKAKKLTYAFQLIEWFSETSENEIFLLNSKVKIKNIKSIPLEEIEKLNF